ncbi:MAG TPA: MBL fold metallo-hydrolase [Bacteroidia bacterium]|nr:MBL fold metallo-hydrolase [Bacteroidia bacterium]
MSLFISALNSGSNGNCYYVGNENEAVLIDQGISCKELEKRMLRAGLSMKKVRAIFVSHEHSDHIRGVTATSRKYEIPVHITGQTLVSSGMGIDEGLTRTFSAYKPVHVGPISVTAFPKFHDASDPHSFVVEQNGIRIGVFTDIGAPCDHVIRNFKGCHAAFLEANYDEEMLSNGTYPAYLKKRIRSDKGHLSNKQALDLFLNHRPDYMNCLLLSHLSRDNNSPELVAKLFAKHADATKIVVCSRYEETAVYRIGISTGGQEEKKPQLRLFR